MDWYNRLDVMEKILSAAAALVVLLGVALATLRRFRPQFTPNLRKVMSRSICLHLGKGPSQIFHTQWPYILPICLKNPARSEYIYIVVGESTDDESKLINTQPRLTIHNIRQGSKTRKVRLTL